MFPEVRQRADILDLSKIESGKMTLYLEEFEVGPVVAELARLVEPLLAKNGNRLEVACAGDLGRMRSDITKVRQVLFNLLSNAAKFTRQGLIRLRVQRVTTDQWPVTSGNAEEQLITRHSSLLK